MALKPYSLSRPSPECHDNWLFSSTRVSVFLKTHRHSRFDNVTTCQYLHSSLWPLCQRACCSQNFHHALPVWSLLLSPYPSQIPTILLLCPHLLLRWYTPFLLPLSSYRRNKIPAFVVPLWVSVFLFLMEGSQSKKRNYVIFHSVSSLAWQLAQGRHSKISEYLYSTRGKTKTHRDIACLKPFSCFAGSWVPGSCRSISLPTELDHKRQCSWPRYIPAISISFYLP